MRPISPPLGAAVSSDFGATGCDVGLFGALERGGIAGTQANGAEWKGAAGRNFELTI